MISRALNALGLMRISEYNDIASMTDTMVGVLAQERDDALERVKLAATDLAKQAEEKANLEFSLSTYRSSLAARTKALDTCEDQNEKLETIIAGLQDELNDAKHHIDHLGITFNQRLVDAVQDYQTDALLWRNARDKRSRNRRGVMTNG